MIRKLISLFWIVLLLVTAYSCREDPEYIDGSPNNGNPGRPIKIKKETKEKTGVPHRSDGTLNGVHAAQGKNSVEIFFDEPEGCVVVFVKDAYGEIAVSSVSSSDGKIDVDLPDDSGDYIIEVSTSLGNKYIGKICR